MAKLHRVSFVLSLVVSLSVFAQSADQQFLSAVDSPDPVVPGNNITYTVQMRNNGPNAATNGGLNVNLDGALSYVSASGPAGFTCSAFGNNVSCTNPAWVAGDTATFTIVASAPASLLNFPDGSFTSNFFSSGVTPDPNNGNNSGSATTAYDSPQIDLSLTVTDSPDPVAPDGNITYTIPVTNGGPNNATNVNFNVYNAQGLTFQSISAPAGWNCTLPAVNGSAIFTCNAPTVVPGTQNFTVVLKAPLAVIGPNDTTVTTAFGVGGTGNDTNTGNNNENETTGYVTPDADLAVSVTDSPDPVFPDGNITYTITVTNSGPDAAPNTQLSIYNEGNLQYQSVSAPAGWNCTPPAVNATPTFTCTLASFPNGGNAVFTLVAQADATLNGIFDHAILTGFTVSSGVSDPVGGNNTDTESTQYTTPDADLAVSVTDSPDPVFPDGNITYTVTVTNSGPDAATSAQLNVFNEGNLQFQSLSAPAGWSCTTPAVNGTVNFGCSNPSFANGGNAVFTLVAQADATLNGIFDHAILTGFSISSGVSDPVNGNNSETESTQYTTPDADISVAVTDSPDPVAPNGNITYTITVANAGPDAATNAALNISNAGTLQFQSITTPAGWSCSAPAVDATPTFSCTNPSFASGASVNFILVAQADATLNGPNDGTIQTFFGVSTSVSDPDNTDNSETENTAYVTPDADIAVTNSDSPDPVTIGGTITYTQSLTNNGPDTATTVTFTETLSSQVGFQSLTAPAGWSCTTPSVGGFGTITCNIASLASGVTANFVVMVTANAGSTISNIVNGGTMTQDPNISNNGAEAVTTVIVPTVADLSISKTTNATNAAPGSTVSYTITVVNNGPDAASNVVVTDTLPASLLFQSINEPAGFDCTTPAAGSTGTITCTAATMPASTNAVFTLVTTVSGSATGTINNSASVTSDTDDNTGGNDSGSSTGVTVGGAGTSDLGVTKTTPTTSAAPGDSVTYTITVTNAGPDTATDVTMSDTLPPSLLFQSLSAAAGFTCSTPAVGASGPVSCIGGTIANGASAVFTLVTTIAPGASGSVANSVNVSSSGSDPDPTDSTATTPGILVGSADLSITKTTGVASAPTGSTISYTITVTNNGPDAATNVIVTDDLPAGLTFISATPSQGTCNASDPVSCNLGTLANGASATIILQAQVIATSGTITNTATVDSTTDDPNGGNNSGTSPSTPVVPGGAGEATGIPTLSEWALIGLAMMLGAIAMRKMA